MKKLLLIDSFNFLHRAFHALPESFRDEKGEPVNAVYGVASMLINVLDLIKPDYAVAALDGMETTFRAEEFTGYKAHRKPMEDNLAIQIPKVIQVLDSFGFKTIVVEGYEADDIIGTFATKYASDDLQVIVVSNDRDMWQLINKNTLVMAPNTLGNAEWVGVKEVEAKYGITPSQIKDYKGLRGDPSDNIPGVYGVGEKTALKLIQQFGSVEGIYEHLDEVTPESLRKKLEADSEEAVRSKHLATIITDAPVLSDLEDCRFDGSDKAKIIELFKSYHFKSLLKRLGYVEESSSTSGVGVSGMQQGLF